MGKARDSLNRSWRWCWWNINRHLVPLVLKRNFGSLRLAEDAAPLPPAPFIMISNHGNFSDPWIVAHYSPQPVSIMMNEEGFKSNIFTRWYLRQIGAFPKKKGLSDVKSMKIALRRLHAGSPLLVFPEGQTTWDGTTQPIYSGIEKIAQRAKVPIVLNRLQGNFLCHPWWSTKRRKGEIIVHRQVISASEVQKASALELHTQILSYIQHNDIKMYAHKPDLFYGPEIAGGLSALLWLCPECGTSDTLVFTRDDITCSHCQTLFTFHPNMTLTEPSKGIADLLDWVTLQKEWTKSTIVKLSEGLTITEQGIRFVRVDYGGRRITLDTGSFFLDTINLIFHGDSGELVFTLDSLSAPVFQQKDILQFEFRGESYQFLLDNLPLFKWLFLLRYLTGYAAIEERGSY